MISILFNNLCVLYSVNCTINHWIQNKFAYLWAGKNECMWLFFSLRRLVEIHLLSHYDKFTAVDDKLRQWICVCIALFKHCPCFVLLGFPILRGKQQFYAFSSSGRQIKRENALINKSFSNSMFLGVVCVSSGFAKVWTLCLKSVFADNGLDLRKSPKKGTNLLVQSNKLCLHFVGGFQVIY